MKVGENRRGSMWTREENGVACECDGGEGEGDGRATNYLASSTVPNGVHICR